MSHFVPTALCAAVLLVAGCEPSGSTATSTPPAKTETQTQTAARPAAEASPAETAAPAAEKPKTAEATKPDYEPKLPKRDTSIVARDPNTSARDTIASTTKSAVQLASHVIVEPARLELGEIPTNDAKSGTVTLRNTGDTPHKVIDCKTSCGCTTANCQKGKTLEPGQEMEVEIKLTGGATPRTLSKTVTFIVSDQKPIRLPVSGTAIAFVTVEPARLDPEQHSDGRLVLKAIDDQPFSILSMYPPIIEGLPTERATEHEVFVSWDALQEQGHRTTKLLFTLDHPKCSKVYGALSPNALPKVATDPQRAPRVEPTGSSVDIDKLLGGDTPDTAGFLEALDKGEIKVNVVDQSGQTPLIKAARWGDARAIQALLDASADIGASDRIGRTPLMYAAQSKNLDAVQVLLDAGADMHQKDNIGNTALCWAAGFGSADIVDELLEGGAEVEVAGPMTGFTPLIWASGFGETESVKRLIEAGADLEAVDVLQRATPLMNAARTGGPENLKVLLEAGADLEARDSEGKTTLLVAASNAGADVNVVEMLISAGADLTATTKAGHSALDLARKRTDLRAEAVVQLLEQHMGK